MASPAKTSRGQYIVDGKGRKKGVVLPLAEYEQLLEDLYDLAIVAERREEKPVCMEQMKRRLKQHGRL